MRRNSRTVLMKRCTAPNAQVATASMQRDYLPSIDPARHGAHGERRAQLAAVAFGPTECAMLQRRSEEHTSELQSRRDLVCRLLLEKKKKKKTYRLNNQKKQDETIRKQQYVQLR